MVETWEVVEKDIERTRMDLHFFRQKIKGKQFDKDLIILSHSKKKLKEIEDNEMDQTHRDIITRILYVFSKTNKAIGYLQGMNELVAIIYYCFYRFGVDSDKDNAEADTFWCFFNFTAPVR